MNESESEVKDLKRCKVSGMDEITAETTEVGLLWRPNCVSLIHILYNISIIKSFP